MRNRISAKILGCVFPLVRGLKRRIESAVRRLCRGKASADVFALNTVNRCIPINLGVGTTEEIDEECRLLYVAITRAKDTLHLVIP